MNKKILYDLPMVLKQKTFFLEKNLFALFQNKTKYKISKILFLNFSIYMLLEFLNVKIYQK